MTAASLPINSEQITKAVSSLLKFIGQQRQETSSLFDEDEFLYLVIALKKVPQDKRKDKPIKIDIPNPLYTFEGADICLFVKDHKGEGHKEAKQRLKQQQLSGVSKVIGLSKLKSKYESHEAKRELCKQYDLFLADSRVLPALPKLIGKSFFKQKKQPIPVDLTRNWSQQIKSACSATYMMPPSGSCINVRVARSSMSLAECSDNVVAAVVNAVDKVPKKADGVSAVFLKTSTSVALPIWQAAPDMPAVIQSHVQGE